ncbi:MAG: hypothetical protein H7145_19765 [Akkermansiaceae bacterium]|nr:hypothetical protein [Armatimonadota bacterium]
MIKIEMKSFVLFLLVSLSLLSIGMPALGSGVNIAMRSYVGDVRMDVKTKSIHVTMDLTLDSTDVAVDSVTYLLNKNAEIKELRWDGDTAQYSFDTTGTSPNRYLPDARMLTIKTPGMRKGTHRLRLKYNCRLDDLKHRGCLFEENWIELNGYSTWFPINYDYGKFSCDVKIGLDKRYRMSGSGSVSGDGNGAWRLMRTTGDTEIVLVASPELHTRRYEKDGRTIRIDSIRMTDAQAEAMLVACRETFDRYEKWFGGTEGKSLTLTLNPTRNVTSYARKGFISLQTEGRAENELYQTIGHEIGHFWWGNAVSNDTWEDWLNESFAEYAALLNDRETYGDEPFQMTIGKYRKVAAPLPPLWEIDRGGDEGGITLYRKGPVILYDLDQKLGHEPFLRLMKEIATRKVARTADLLTLIETQTSAETRRWLEDALKK